LDPDLDVEMSNITVFEVLGRLIIERFVATLYVRVGVRAERAQTWRLWGLHLLNPPRFHGRKEVRQGYCRLHQPGIKHTMQSQ
jgi:hypothetical protein